MAIYLRAGQPSIYVPSGSPAPTAAQLTGNAPLSEGQSVVVSSPSIEGSLSGMVTKPVTPVASVNVPIQTQAVPVSEVSSSKSEVASVERTLPGGRVVSGGVGSIFSDTPGEGGISAKYELTGTGFVRVGSIATGSEAVKNAIPLTDKNGNLVVAASGNKLLKTSTGQVIEVNAYGQTVGASSSTPRGALSVTANEKGQIVLKNEYGMSVGTYSTEGKFTAVNDLTGVSRPATPNEIKELIKPKTDFIEPKFNNAYGASEQAISVSQNSMGVFKITKSAEVSRSPEEIFGFSDYLNSRFQEIRMNETGQNISNLPKLIIYPASTGGSIIDQPYQSYTLNSFVPTGKGNEFGIELVKYPSGEIHPDPLGTLTPEAQKHVEETLFSASSAVKPAKKGDLISSGMTGVTGFFAGFQDLYKAGQHVGPFEKDPVIGHAAQKEIIGAGLNIGTFVFAAGEIGYMKATTLLSGLTAMPQAAKGDYEGAAGTFIQTATPLVALGALGKAYDVVGKPRVEVQTVTTKVMEFQKDGMSDNQLSAFKILGKEGEKSFSMPTQSAGSYFTYVRGETVKPLFGMKDGKIVVGYPTEVVYPKVTELKAGSRFEVAPEYMGKTVKEIVETQPQYPIKLGEFQKVKEELPTPTNRLEREFAVKYLTEDYFQPAKGATKFTEGLKSGIGLAKGSITERSSFEGTRTDFRKELTTSGFKPEEIDILFDVSDTYSVKGYRYGSSTKGTQQVNAPLKFGSDLRTPIGDIDYMLESKSLPKGDLAKIIVQKAKEKGLVYEQGKGLENEGQVSLIEKGKLPQKRYDIHDMLGEEALYQRTDIAYGFEGQKAIKTKAGFREKPYGEQAVRKITSTLGIQRGDGGFKLSPEIVRRGKDAPTSIPDAETIILSRERNFRSRLPFLSRGYNAETVRMRGQLATWDAFVRQEFPEQVRLAQEKTATMKVFDLSKPVSKSSGFKLATVSQLTSHLKAQESEKYLQGLKSSRSPSLLKSSRFASLSAIVRPSSMSLRSSRLSKSSISLSSSSMSPSRMSPSRTSYLPKSPSFTSSIKPSPISSSISLNPSPISGSPSKPYRYKSRSPSQYSPPSYNPYSPSPSRSTDAPSPYPSPIPSPPMWPFGGGGRKGSRGGNRRGFEYDPNLTAKVFNIHGKTPRGILQGVSFRPLPMLSRKSRRGSR